jgi:hypothetical protein
MRKITAEAYRRGPIQREYADPRQPVATAEDVRFNGVGELGHETFGFRTGASDPFGFCKTARKPYDDVVMRVLLVLASYRPGFELSSDGDFGHEWIEALDWFNQKVGRAYVKDQIHFEMPGLDRPQSLSSLTF